MEEMEKKQNNKKTASGVEEPKYSLPALRKNCGFLFGVTGSTFDGAMHSRKDTALSIAEAKKIIEAWKKKQRGGKK